MANPNGIDNLPKDEHGNIIPGPGRPKGLKNKTTVMMQDLTAGAIVARGAELRLELERRIARRKNKKPTDEEASMLRMDEQQLYMLHMARQHPKDFHTMVSKLMPNQIDLSVAFTADTLIEQVSAGRRRLAMKDKIIEGTAEEVEE